MTYTKSSIIGLLLSNNMISMHSARDFYDYSMGKTGMFSVPGFAEEFLAWTDGKSEKVILDKAACCHNLWLNHCTLETMLSTLTGEQLQLALSDLPSQETIEHLFYETNSTSNWIKKFYKASNNKDAVTKALIKVSKFEATRYGWKVEVGDVSDVFIPYVGEDTLDVVLSNKKAYSTFKKWLTSKYPQYKDYIHYLLSYGDMGKKGKTLALEMCQHGNLQLAKEFDNPKIVPAVKGFILVNGAGPIVKDIARNMGISSKEATKLLMMGKESLAKIAKSKLYCKYPLRCLSWTALRWWINKQNSAEWDKDRIAYGPAGNQVHWTWRSRLDEIRSEYIETDKDSPSKVMAKVFQAAEERRKRQETRLEDLKKEAPFRKCPLAIIAPSNEFKQVLTPYELHCVGEQFQNCAFTYKQALRDGKCYIFYSDKLCIEIVPPKHGWITSNWILQQVRGFHNSAPDKGAESRLKLWFDRAVRMYTIRKVMATNS